MIYDISKSRMDNSLLHKLRYHKAQWEGIFGGPTFCTARVFVSPNKIVIHQHSAHNIDTALLIFVGISSAETHAVGHFFTKGVTSHLMEQALAQDCVTGTFIPILTSFVRDSLKNRTIKTT